MTLFSGPEYASYIALMRELALEHEYDEGDYVCWTKDPIEIEILMGWRPQESAYIWLPRLDQWLAMLEQAGIEDISFWTGDGYAKCGVLLPTDDDGGIECGDLETAPTHEEAAARLWMVVAGAGQASSAS